MHVIQSYNIEAESILNGVIVKGDIPSSYIPAVQYSILLRSTPEKALENRQIFFKIH